MDMSGRWYLSHKWLRWITRTCLVVSTLGVFITSYVFYAPYYYPFSSHIEPQIGQALLYGGILIGITAFAWIWPIAGGIMAILYCIIKLVGISAPEPLTLIPIPLYVLLYIVFLAGGVMYMILGLTREKQESVSLPSGERLKLIARISAFTPIVLNVILHWLIYPLPFVLGSIPGLVTAGIAWFWPAPGGFLMLLLSIPGFYLLFESNWGFQQKLPVYIFSIVFIISGFLHLIIAWRGRRLHSALRKR